MKILNSKKIAIGLALILGVASQSYAGQTTTKYVYEGDSSARSICLAIANNNVTKLNRALKSQRISRLDNKVHERFECNGKNLFSFAEKMNASLAANYLAPKFGYNEGAHVIASTKN